MKKTFDFLALKQSTGDLNRFFNINITENKIDLMGKASKENLAYYKERGWHFEYNNNIGMLMSTIVESDITVRIILTPNL